ncbi:hypothetical protein [Picosynechococcus sp. PCC 8807]|uniref:hypothetical protein n=1 Tax=Picosynechococcus sp. PCC 8807 TaxID=195248 RepID=UPI001E56B071|nr:hypothetical protein [Picosynechococcus sp. PCC 8807]
MVMNLKLNFFWGFWLLYVGTLLLAPSHFPFGGEPLWQLQPETLTEVKQASLNFFFVLPILNYLGWRSPLAPVLNPVDEALFNFAVAWMWLFLPVMASDRKGQHLPYLAFWGCGMFLTNVFLLPYMALRRAIAPQPFLPKPWFTRFFAWVGICVGIIAIGWFGLARPEFGLLGDRLDYFLLRLGDSRLTVAFMVDLLCFWFIQIFLMGDLTAKDSFWQTLRFVPFFGVACWLLFDHRSS